MQVLANQEPGGGIIVTPATVLTIAGGVYICEPVDELEEICGATSSYVRITLPSGESVLHDTARSAPATTCTSRRSGRSRRRTSPCSS